MNIGVIVNPVACTDGAAPLKAALSERGVATSWFETTKSDPGPGAVSDALGWGADAVIVCGGDGTVRACAEGLARAAVPMAISPAGTGNLLARNLELPSDPEAVVEAAVSGRRVRTDLGRVEGEVFAVMAGAGLDAAIMAETSSEAKDRFGVLSYIVEGLRHISDPPTEARIIADGNEVRADSWLTILVGNLGRLPGGVDMFPDSRIRDGALDLVAVPAGGLTSTAGIASSILAGEDHEDLLRLRGSHFTVEFSSPTRYELDGEARDEIGLLDFTVDDSALEVCVPEQSERS
ncbi:MAG: diacylglycerol kinase family protein [Acidimicrobiia bacterium]